jgi:hypothetical protein
MPNLEDDSRLGHIKLGIGLGQRITLDVVEARGLSLGDFVTRFLKGRDWQVESKRVFIFQNTAGAECEAPITAWEAYAQITATFRFSKGQ